MTFIFGLLLSWDFLELSRKVYDSVVGDVVDGELTFIPHISCM
jgi:hypothetical protein